MLGRQRAAPQGKRHMSRIGKKPVAVPVERQGRRHGQEDRGRRPAGQARLGLAPRSRPSPSTTTRSRSSSPATDDTRLARALHGLTRAVIANMVEGVTKGYEKKLEIVGVGYLAAVQEGKLQLRVGFANEVQMPIPAGLKVTCPDQTHVVIKGSDKQMVGQFAAEVRSRAQARALQGQGHSLRWRSRPSQGRQGDDRSNHDHSVQLIKNQLIKHQTSRPYRGKSTVNHEQAILRAAYSGAAFACANGTRARPSGRG